LSRRDAHLGYFCAIPNTGSARWADLDDHRTATFWWHSGVSIYSGFAGTEEPATFGLANRDLIANETILNGDLDRDDDTGGDSS